MSEHIKFTQNKTLRLLRGARLRIVLAIILQGSLLLYIATTVPQWDWFVSATSFFMIFLLVGCIWWLQSIERRICKIKKMIRGEIPISDNF